MEIVTTPNTVNSTQLTDTAMTFDTQSTMDILNNTNNNSTVEREVNCMMQIHSLQSKVCRWVEKKKESRFLFVFIIVKWDKFKYFTHSTYTH